MNGKPSYLIGVTLGILACDYKYGDEEVSLLQCKGSKTGNRLPCQRDVWQLLEITLLYCCPPPVFKVNYVNLNVAQTLHRQQQQVNL